MAALSAMLQRVAFLNHTNIQHHYPDRSLQAKETVQQNELL